MERQIYFARHVHDWPVKGIDGSFIEYLFKNRMIAIQFDSIDSWDESNYSPHGKAAVRYMNSCNRDSDPQHIFSTYKINGRIFVLSGTPKKGSKALLSDLLQRSDNPKIKLLSLEDAKELSRTDFPFPHLLPPKQSTFVRWLQCEKIANNYLNGCKFDLLDINSYLPNAIEVACEEYLRDLKILHAKTYKAGGELKDYDIIGITHDSRNLLCQVKNRSRKNHEDKFFELANLQPDSTHIMFTESQRSVPEKSNVRLILISDVINYLYKCPRYGEAYLTKLSDYS